MFDRAAFHLEPVEDVPEDEQLKAAGAALELEQEELKQAQSLATKVRGLSTQYQTKLRSIVGDENLERYVEFRRGLRTEVRDVVTRARPTVVGETEVREARLQAAEKSRKFLKKIRFDMARASKLRGDFHTQFDEVVSKAIGRPEEPNYMLLPEMVPEEIHNPWKIYRPPYPAGYQYCWKNKSDEPNWPYCYTHLHTAAGQLGSYSHIHVSGADDSDYAYARCRTAMRFWYYLPVAGMVEIYMRMQSIHTPYSGWLSDEWGWSDSACDQESYAYLRVLYPAPKAPRKSTILDYRRTGTDASWSRDVVPDGYCCRWPHFFSADAYPGGTWLRLEVGIDDWNRFWSNDVSICSRMNLKWFLSRVYVRSTGE